MVSKNRAAKRRRAQSKKAGAERGKAARTEKAGAEAREEGPGGGPIGAMIRWGRHHARLAFIWGFPPATTPEAKALEAPRLRRMADRQQRGGIGVARGLVERCSEEAKARFQKPPFVIVDLPTRGLKTLQSALRPKVEVGALTSTIAALVNGVPLLWSVVEDAAEQSAKEGEENSERAAGLEALVLEGFRAKGKADQALDAHRGAAAAWMSESVALAEKPLLNLLSTARGEAREATLSAALRRMTDQRRRWAARHGERLLRRYVPAGEGARPDLAFLDLLPPLVIAARGGRVAELAEALATPLGVMALGLCSAFLETSKGEP